MREQEALVRLQAHRDQCQDGCPRTWVENANVEDLCPAGAQKLVDYITADEDS